MACVSGSISTFFRTNIILSSNNNSKLSPKLSSSSLTKPTSLPLKSLRISRAKRKVGGMATTTPSVKAEAVTIEKSGVKIVRNPPESKLAELGVRSWPKWGCPPSKFPWTYSATETCYLLQGKVKVLPDGSDEPVEITAGDLVVFPKGMSCTWDVSEGVDKHYKFD